MQIASLDLDSSWESGFVNRPNNPKIRYCYFPPKSGQAKRLIVFIIGRNEFVEKYSYLVDELDLPEDCGFLTWDHRGQGASEGQTSHCDSFDSYAADAQMIISHINKDDAPYMIIALSMGALTTLYGSRKGILKPKMAVLISPFLGFPTKKFPAWFTKSVSFIMTKFGLNKKYIRPKGIQPAERFETNDRTNNKELFVRMLKSPYSAKSVTFGWLNAARLALTTVHSSNFISNLKFPISIVAGDQDTVVSFVSISRWVNLYKATNKTYPISYTQISGAKHEILGEKPEYFDVARKEINTVIDKFVNS